MKDLNVISNIIGRTIKSVEQKEDYDFLVNIIFDDNSKLEVMADGEGYSYLNLELIESKDN